MEMLKLIDLSEGWVPIGCKWVYLKKRNKKGEVVKHKAKLIVVGFSQKLRINYSDNDTFVPVMRFETLQQDLHVPQSTDGTCSGSTSR